MTEAIGKGVVQPNVTLEVPKVPTDMQRLAKLVSAIAGLIEGVVLVATPLLVKTLFDRVEAFSFDNGVDEPSHVKAGMDQSFFSVAAKSAILPVGFIAGFAFMFRRSMQTFFSPERDLVMQAQFDKIMDREVDSVQLTEAQQKVEIQEALSMGQMMGAMGAFVALLGAVIDSSLKIISNYKR